MPPFTSGNSERGCVRKNGHGWEVHGVGPGGTTSREWDGSILRAGHRGAQRGREMGNWARAGSWLALARTLFPRGWSQDELSTGTGLQSAPPGRAWQGWPQLELL